jgi:hypothetical protein
MAKMAVQLETMRAEVVTTRNEKAAIAVKIRTIN